MNTDHVIQSIKNGNINFRDLDSINRDNPEILKAALTSTKNDQDICNPISFAGPNALTTENIELALQMKCYFLLLNFNLRGNKRFILLAYEKGELHQEFYNLELFNFSKEMQNDLDVIKAYIKRKPNKFKDLEYEYRNNPEILKIALTNAKNNVGYSNPISYTEKDALTEENIDLALQLDKLNIENNPLLANCRYFIIEGLKKGIKTYDFRNISEELKNDPEIASLLNMTKRKIVGKPISLLDQNTWSPEGEIQRYKWHSAVIAILPNNEWYEKEVRGTENPDYSHDSAINDIVYNNIIKRHLEETDIQFLESEFNDINTNQDTKSNRFVKAQKCSEYNIMFILIEGETIQIYFPSTITRYQFAKLTELLSEVKGVEFHIIYEIERFDDTEDLYNDPERNILTWNDIVYFIRIKDILIKENEDSKSSKK